MTYTEWMEVIDGRNAASQGLRVWSLTRERQIAEARMHPHPQGLELKITISGAHHWSGVVSRNLVQQLLDSLCAGKREDLLIDGWRPFGWRVNANPR